MVAELAMRGVTMAKSTRSKSGSSGGGLTIRSVCTVLSALMVGVAGGLVSPTAEATTGTLLYSCSGPGFGTGSYPFLATVDTDLPASLPYGSQGVAGWTTTLVAPDAFRAWAQAQGFTTLWAGARLGTALDGATQPTLSQSTPPLAVPTTAGGWTWTTTPMTTTVAASATGRHAFTLTSLEVTVAFHDASGPRWATSATCVLDPSVPAGELTIDAYDVVAASTTTALALKGDTATATVTSNGATPDGTVTFSVGGTSVTVGVVSGRATAKLPSVPPGAYTVSAQFVPTQPSQLTTSTVTAPYVAPRIVTSTKASAKYRPVRDQLKARARVAALDGSDVSGRVTFILKRNGRKIDNVTVGLSSEDVAVKKFRGISKSGRYLVVAKYLGTRTFEPSKDRVRLTLT